MTKKTFECSYCHNWWSIEEGFHLKTMQCAGCQKWDDEKPIRELEQKKRDDFKRQYPNGINFPYMAGDPFW